MLPETTSRVTTTQESHDYVHSIFKICSTSDFNFPLEKYQIWNTQDLHFFQAKPQQSLEHAGF